MQEFLKRTKLVIASCEKHLEDSNAHNTEIESYLTQYLLIALYAEIEQAIETIIDQRAD